MRDYLLLIQFTGLRRTEAASLKWSDIDFGNRVLNVSSSCTKNQRSHSLPMPDFLVELLQRRFASRGQSEYVFPGKGNMGFIKDSSHVIEGVARDSGFEFTLHDLRRGFMTMAAKLDVPHYVIKKLANHISGTDVTTGYLILDVDRLRAPMNKIADRFLALFGVNAAASCCPEI